MNRGWIKVYRKIGDNPLWTSEKFTRGQAWVDLVILANHKPGWFLVRGNRVDVKRGQIGRSILSLSERWKWSEGKVSRFLNMLEKDGQIWLQKSRLTTLITLVNYEVYQENNVQKEEQTADKEGADSGQTGINKNDKEQSRITAEHIARLKDLKKLAGGSRDHTLCDKYSVECGIHKASYDDLKMWAINQIAKMKEN